MSQIQGYINQSRAAGKTNEIIQQELRNAGWQEADISQAFNVGVAPTSITPSVTPTMTSGASATTATVATISTAVIVKISIAIVAILAVAGGGYTYYKNNVASSTTQQTDQNTNTLKEDAVGILSSSTSKEDVTITSKMKDGSIDTSYYSKNKMRYAEGLLDTIIEFSTGKITTIDHDKKEYSEITTAEIKKSLEESAAQLEQTMAQMPPEMRDKIASKTGATNNEPIVTKGEIKTIAGYNCQMYTVTLGETITQEQCNTTEFVPPFNLEDLKKLTEITAPMNDGLDKFAKALLELPGFPLSQHTVMKDAGRKDEFSIEVTNIIKGSIDASIFEIPTGYKKIIY
jgi:hypothetical protein